MSAPIRIVHLEPLSDWIRGVYEGLLADSALEIEWAGDVPDEALGRTVAGAHVLITRKRPVDRGLMAAAGPSLGLVQVVGRAPWAVDPAAAYREGVDVSVLPHTGAIAVAEHTLALMLGVARRLASAHEGTVTGAYRERGLEPALTDERTFAFDWLRLEGAGLLHGRTLGLVGLGDIGLEVARRARAFDMEVLYTKRTRLPQAHERLAEVSFAPLDTLLAESDVVSLHVPHTEETAGLVDARALRLMRPTAILVNTARGGLVDEEALVVALGERRIAGAGLDVFAREPLPAGHPLTALDNVLLTPHMGGVGGAGQKGMAAAVVANLERVARGEPPEGVQAP